MVLIGADPEFFVRKNHRFVSGHVFKCGTKIIPLRTKHGAVQVDGLALEANVIPSSTKEEFIANLKGVIGDLNEIVATDGCEIVAIPTATFSKKYMKSLPKEVKELGCNPDYNAYSMSMNDRPNSDVPFRTGAGHIHIGWTKGKDLDDVEHFQNCADLARQMDYFVGLRTLKFDQDAQRRQLYGAAGAFRPKSYGMEYRVPSSAWCRTEALMGEIFDATMACVDYAQNGNDLDKEHQGFAQVCIDKNITDWDKLNPEVAKVIGYASAS